MGGIVHLIWNGRLKNKVKKNKEGEKRRINRMMREMYVVNIRKYIRAQINIISPTYVRF